MPAQTVDRGTFLFGAVAGAIIGTVLALLYAPVSGAALRHKVQSTAQDAENSIRASVAAVVPQDPVAESIAEGKAAARRRRDELLGSR